MSEIKKENDTPGMKQTENDPVQEDAEQTLTDTDAGDTDAEEPLEVQLAKAKEETASLKDRMLRSAAENDNFKKRLEREKIASLKYAGETIFREILPSVDNLERAVSQGTAEGADAEARQKSLIEGVQMTLKSLMATLAKFEVKPIESVGKPFDPQHQEALVMEASDTVPAQHVVNEYEKGFWYKDRLLRPAKVIVSSGEKNG
ncbi:nucleotide exchange factor GrpE [Desulforhopalus vacuolatus]|uniref:nucleotide exchange factor GrpE n=1 Tax=Desulforhopalus vacuolatus TaxID=40414 RepID=UPI001964FF67|nr:nucleotide exchange factor GrpE [Desulforhopalus vacuolatus]MBM9518614.1 nucleotide exchange factor GrpE [Desulforhopalus vacuolatus]